MQILKIKDILSEVLSHVIDCSSVEDLIKSYKCLRLVSKQWKQILDGKRMRSSILSHLGISGQYIFIKCKYNKEYCHKFWSRYGFCGKHSLMDLTSGATIGGDPLCMDMFNTHSETQNYRIMAICIL